MGFLVKWNRRRLMVSEVRKKVQNQGKKRKQGRIHNSISRVRVGRGSNASTIAFRCVFALHYGQRRTHYFSILKISQRIWKCNAVLPPDHSNIYILLLRLLVFDLWPLFYFIRGQRFLLNFFSLALLLSKRKRIPTLVLGIDSRRIFAQRKYNVGKRLILKSR